MDKITLCTDALSDAILQSEQYKNYLYYKELLEREPQLCNLVNDIRRKNFFVQNTADFSSDEASHELEKFKDEYELAKSNEIAYNFFAAELTMCRIIQEVNYKLIKGLDFDISFLNN